jgi:sortase A
MKKTNRVKTWLVRSLLVIGILIGLALVFNEQIKLLVIDQMLQRTIKQVDRGAVNRNQKRQATFNFSAVKALDVQTVSAAVKNNDVRPIGKLAIPHVKMALPILKGLANDNLSVGAGTMKSDQKMSSGNYALAGHYII